MIHGISQENASNALAGWIYSPSGHSTPIVLASGDYPGHENLAFNNIYPVSTLSETQKIIIYYNGIEICSIDGNRSSINVGYIGNSASKFQNFSVLNIQNTDQSINYQSNNYLSNIQVGDKIKITWTENATPDFAAYVLLWDEGNGGTPSVIYDTIVGRSNTTYITESLSSGTYRFLIIFKDLAGNEGVDPSIDYDEVKEIKIDTPPDTPTVEYDYDVSSRKITFKITGLDSNSPELFANYSFGMGFSDVVDYGSPLGLKSLGSNLFDSPELWEGQFVFYICAINENGVKSEPFILSANLTLQDGNLLMLDYVDEILDISAYQLAGGEIKIEWQLEDATKDVELYVSTDNETFTLEATNDDLAYTFSGVGGTTYYFKARVKDEQSEYIVYGNFSEVVSEIADDSAPSGSQEIVVQLI